MAWLGKASAPLTLDMADSPADVRKAILSYLRTHRNWYARWSLFYSIAWNMATLLIVILGALSSILTAAGTPEQPAVHAWVLITLPAISSLLAALLIQFKLKDACRLRELGRITAEELICKALIIPTDNKENALKAAIALRELAHQLERNQLAEFLAESPTRSTNAEHPPSGKANGAVETKIV